LNQSVTKPEAARLQAAARCHRSLDLKIAACGILTGIGYQQISALILDALRGEGRSWWIGS
jgi:hypothetical protein